jgi:FKBP-type peptidyl-prolyl cis-trans isomerase FklB
MKHGHKLIIAVGLCVAWLGVAGAADDKPAMSDKDKMSYALGMNIGNSLKRGMVEMDVDVLAGAIKDVLTGKDLKLTDAQAQEAFRMYQTQARAKVEEERKRLSEKNNKEGEAFLAQNKSKPGVKTHTVTLPDGKTAEMQYKVITEGSGAIPKTNDMVSVNYRGTLINGKEFDSSAKTGQPAKFGVNRVIRGWTEALSMMKVGSKWELYIPAALAYGDIGQRNIEPGATLIFEVELLGAEPAPAPVPAQPLTSDIIRVPSQDEMKKGAKIEVIKAEDAEKLAKQATNSAAEKK